MDFVKDAKRVVRNDCITKIDSLAALIRNGKSDPRFKKLPKDLKEEADNLKEALKNLFTQVSNKKVTDQEVVEVDDTLEQIFVIYKQIIDILKEYAGIGTRK